MIAPEILDKLENIMKAVKQSNAAKNNGEVFVRETLKRAKDAKLVDQMLPEQIEAAAAETWLKQVTRNPNDFLQIAEQRRNHKMMLKMMRHYDEAIRIEAASRFLIVFAMMDGYFDEASSLINQILLQPTEILEVKRALLSRMVDNQGHSSRRGSPRGIVDTARQLINDIDQEVAYHALRVLTALSDVRDWKTVLDRMLSLMGEDDVTAEYFLSAGVDYLQLIMLYEPTVVEWMQTLIRTYPRTHLAMVALERIVFGDPDLAFESKLIDEKTYRAVKKG